MCSWSPLLFRFHHSSTLMTRQRPGIHNINNSLLYIINNQYEGRVISSTAFEHPIPEHFCSSPSRNSPARQRDYCFILYQWNVFSVYWPQSKPRQVTSTLYSILSKDCTRSRRCHRKSPLYLSLSSPTYSFFVVPR